MGIIRLNAHYTYRSGVSWMLGLVMVLLAGPTAAQPAQFRIKEQQLLDARALIEPIAHRVVVLGAAVRLVPRSDPTARAAFRTGFQVRMYRISEPGSIPERLATFEPCVVFVGGRLRVGGAEGMDETLLRFEDPGWLTIRPDGRVEPGRWLLVAEPLGDDNPVVRMDRGRADSMLKAYFGTGMYIEIAPPAAPLDPKQVEVALKRGHDFWLAVSQAATANSADRDCLRLAPTTQPDVQAMVGGPLACVVSTTEAEAL